MYHFEIVTLLIKLQQISKPGYAQVGLANNSPKCSTVKVFMIRHNKLRKWIISTKDNMAAVLSPKIKPGFQ